MSPQKARLCHATTKALDHALAKTRAGKPISSVGKTIQSVAKAHGFKVIRNLAGHGLGRSLHEEPKEKVGFYDPKISVLFVKAK